MSASQTDPLKDLRIIIGLDFGTTYTGVAFCTSNSTPETIQVNVQWPKSATSRASGHKVPSRIAYPEMNGHLFRRKWGFDANYRYRTCSWFKLLLEPKAIVPESGVQSILAQQDGVLQLPPGFSAKDVCKHFLTFVWEFVEAFLAYRYLTPAIMRNTPVDVVLTVPALWGEAAKNTIRDAAKEAGFGGKQCDGDIQIITEPEAAALTIIYPSIAPSSIDPVRPKETLLICDCGGGTTDLITYTVESFDPPRFSEACRGDGKNVGTSSIQATFHEWMTSTFGDAYISLISERRDLRCMEKFEDQIIQFQPLENDGEEYQVLKLENVCMDIGSSEYFDWDEKTVIIPWRIMEQLFLPTVNEILSLIKSQIQRAKRKHRCVDRIVLVGGLGENTYLQSVVRRFCDKKRPSMKLTVPIMAQSAIMRGAVIRGLTGIKPCLRVARYHYGFCTSKTFRKGKDDPENAWYSVWDRRMMASERVDWFIAKNAAISGDFVVNRYVKREVDEDELGVAYAIELYKSSNAQAPQFTTLDSHEATLEITFTAEDLEKTEKEYSERLQKWVRLLEYDIVVTLSSETGLLAFSVFDISHDHVLGTHTLKFNDEN